MSPGNFKAVNSGSEVLSHSLFCTASGDRQDTEVLCVWNRGKKEKQVLIFGCKLLKAKGNSKLKQMIQMKHFDIQ